MEHLWNCISRIIRVWSLFCSIRVYAISTNCFVKLVFCLLIKTHACTELLSFGVLKTLFIKKNVEYSQTERVKNTIK